MLKVIFRTNATPDVGCGHLMRCRSLAIALLREGNQCIMAGPDLTYRKPEDHDLFSHWLSIPEWSSSTIDAELLITLATKHQAQWLVLDDYRIDESYQLTIRQSCCRCLKFDGTANQPLWADIVINTNPLVQYSDYFHVLRNPDAKLLLGPTYSILRPEFESVPVREAGRTVNNNILVTFGGGYDHGAIKYVLSTLVPHLLPHQRCLVVSGSSNPNNKELKTWIDMYGQEKLVYLLTLPILAISFQSLTLQ